MSSKKPIVDYSGFQKEIASGDTIDPAFLPASSGGGVPFYVPSATTFSTTQYQQSLAAQQIECDGVIDVSNGLLIFVN